MENPRDAESEIYPRIFTLKYDTPADVRGIANIHIESLQGPQGPLSFVSNRDRNICMNRKKALQKLSRLLASIYGETQIGAFHLIDQCK
jgi:hypothetical protein